METQNYLSRYSLIGLGHLLYGSFNWFVDHVVYVYAVYTWGIWQGGGAMMLFSLVQCAATLHFYEKMQIDWVGAGALHAWQLRCPQGVVGHLYSRISNNRKMVFVFLCVFSDPFITTAYFRKGRFNGLAAEDWRVFLWSVLVSNGYWIGVSALMGNGLAAVWLWLCANPIFIKYLSL